MRNRVYSMLLGSCLVFTSLYAKDAQNGKDLYYEAKCQKCHTSEDFTSEKRKVKDYAKLQWRVKRCDFTMDAGWFDEDVEDVVHYLNSSFYKFDTKK
ncbi:MAG: cytochrome c [Campylobacterota bacterium]|nr:cytochrome c [Campylobacterota bacterium]